MALQPKHWYRFNDALGTIPNNSSIIPNEETGTLTDGNSGVSLDLSAKIVAAPSKFSNALSGAPIIASTTFSGLLLPKLTTELDFSKFESAILQDYWARVDNSAVFTLEITNGDGGNSLGINLRKVGTINISGATGNFTQSFIDENNITHTITSTGSFPIDNAFHHVRVVTLRRNPIVQKAFIDGVLVSTLTGDAGISLNFFTGVFPGSNNNRRIRFFDGGAVDPDVSYLDNYAVFDAISEDSFSIPTIETDWSNTGLSFGTTKKLLISLKDFMDSSFINENPSSPIDLIDSSSDKLPPRSTTALLGSLQLNQPARNYDPLENGFFDKQESMIFSNPLYANSKADIAGFIKSLSWDEQNLGRGLIDASKPDWTASHWLFRLSDTEDMKNGTDWQGLDQFGVFSDDAKLEDMEKALILNNWITSNDDFLPISAEDNTSSYTVNNSGGRLAFSSAGADSIGHHIQTRFNPRRRISFNSDPANIDDADVIHRYINFTLESDTLGALLEVQLGWRYLSNVSNGRGILNLTRLIEINNINEPIEYFIDISDTSLFSKDVTGTIFDTEPPPTLAYFALKIVDPTPANFKLYRIRALNGIFSTTTPPPSAHNQKKGTEKSDFGIVQGGRFVQLMLVLSTTNPPLSPQIKRVSLDINESQGTLPTPDQFVGGFTKWVEPDISPKFALNEPIHKNFS